ncbi:hypothetical protein P154DRAFT_288840 [Amniculicola lignicola CBS 123094]|uniref:Uncharacterized protein n=1 Tax=Amniculicola lignicola CBS 123094 TaxID=1392246 RepID=A0A6A5WXQ8_9PLEO|nr:hypothetical protein P154DRAFT_288840 [Amniculicola lignicola CBS 123094]
MDSNSVGRCRPPRAILCECAGLEVEFLTTGNPRGTSAGEEFVNRSLRSQGWEGAQCGAVRCGALCLLSQGRNARGGVVNQTVGCRIQKTAAAGASETWRGQSAKCARKCGKQKQAVAVKQRRERHDKTLGMPTGSGRATAIISHRRVGPCPSNN